MKGVLGIATQSVAIRYLIPRPRWRRVVLVASKKSPQCSFLLTTRTKGPEDHLTVHNEVDHCLSSEALPRGVFYPKGRLGDCRNKIGCYKVLDTAPQVALLNLCYIYVAGPPGSGVLP